MQFLQNHKKCLIGTFEIVCGRQSPGATRTLAYHLNKKRRTARETLSVRLEAIELFCNVIIKINFGIYNSLDSL